MSCRNKPEPPKASVPTLHDRAFHRRNSSISLQLKKKTMHSICGKRINSVCKENSAHVDNLTNAEAVKEAIWYEGAEKQSR